MAIPAMALLQHHDARRDILIEPAAQRQMKLGIIPNWGRSQLGTQSGLKNQPACFPSFSRYSSECPRVPNYMLQKHGH